MPALFVFWMHGYYDDGFIYKLVALSEEAFTAVDCFIPPENAATDYPRPKFTSVINECHFHSLEKKDISSKASWRYVY